MELVRYSKYKKCVEAATTSVNSLSIFAGQLEISFQQFIIAVCLLCLTQLGTRNWRFVMLTAESY